MLNFSPEKLFLVGLIALVVLGPNRLPQAARSLGRLVAELRRMSSNFHEEVRDAMGDTMDPLVSASQKVTQLRPPDVRKAVRQAITVPPAAAAPSDDSSGETPGATGLGRVRPGPVAVPDDPTLN